MAIEKITSGLQNATVAKTSGHTGSRKDEASVAEAQRDGDSLKYTAAAKDLRQALANLDTIPVINAERVATVKAELENGSYRIDAEQIAEKLMSLEKQLPDTR